MAVRQRILNSTAPFSGSSKAAELKGLYLSNPIVAEGTEEGDWKNGKMDPIACYPILKKLLTQGTAEQVGEGPLKTSTFIAQAECETQDSQEFSPSCSERSYVASPNCFISSSLSSEPNNVACPTTATLQEPFSSAAQNTHRKKPRKRQKRKEKKKEEKRGRNRQRPLVPSSVPEQESGSFPVHTQTNLRAEDVTKSEGGRLVQSTSSSSIQRPEFHGTGPIPLFTPQIYGRGPSGIALGWGSLSSYGQDSPLDSVHSSVGDCTLALAGLRGSVSQGDPCYAGPFVRDVLKDVWEEEEEEEVSANNEGLIFQNENIQPVDSEYTEGREYILSEFIKQGSFGEVYSAQDVNTRYKFAAKKIPLKRFNSEEVGAWSTLRYPHIVQLFGVIREGPQIVLLMDLKHGSLGQLIAERGRIPEDLALHYLCQVLGALEYLAKKRVVHLDVKADNVLLSEDGRDTFLCDFGHAEKLDTHGQSLNGNQELKGTETHMAPEMVRGQPRGAKADVWSSCCMFLHMLSGAQPWTRYYTCRLYLKIANEPPPLREIPPDCCPLTAQVLKAGLQKEPIKRASASDLKAKTAKALTSVGGLTSPVRGPYLEPLHVLDDPPCSPQLSSNTSTSEKEDLEAHGKSPSQERREKKLSSDEDTEENNDEDEEKNNDEQPEHSSPLSLQTLMRNEYNCKTRNIVNYGSEGELHKLERDFYLSSLSQPHSAEMQEQLLSCISSDCYSNWDTGDKKDSGRWSISPGDDLSSGVFSYNSQADGQLFSLDWLGHAQLPTPRCFEGVDICIRDFDRRSIQIRESRRVKVGHIATGISDQISERVFTLETIEGQLVAHDEEVNESGLQLCCVFAPDNNPAWRWRIRDGLLETRDRICSSHFPPSATSPSDEF